MDLLSRLIAQWRLRTLYQEFLQCCGVLFILLNLRDLYFPSDHEFMGGFYGQLALALLLAVVVMRSQQGKAG